MTICWVSGENEPPRRKRRGILADYQFFYAASGGEYNPKRFKGFNGDSPGRQTREADNACFHRSRGNRASAVLPIPRRTPRAFFPYIRPGPEIKYSRMNRIIHGHRICIPASPFIRTDDPVRGRGSSPRRGRRSGRDHSRTYQNRTGTGWILTIHRGRRQRIFPCHAPPG